MKIKKTKLHFFSHILKQPFRILSLFFSNYKAKQEHHLLEKDLPHALNNNELQLFYQPQFDSQTGKIRGFEALLRWNHPRLGLISPDKFIPIAERTGLITPIGEWVLKEACKKNKNIQTEYLSSSVMSVNISAIQLRDPFFSKKVFTILKETNHPTNLLELEITESVQISQPQCISMINEINKEGVKISADDFGTGYSSLNYLCNLSINTIKIDKSFITAIPDSEKNNIILQSIIRLAHELKLYVIAEGVETYEQLHKLKKHGCDCIQGYLFSRPIPAKELPNLFDKMKRHQ